MEKLDAQKALQQRVFSTGMQKNTQRCLSDERLQTMIPPQLPDLLTEYTKAIRKAKPKDDEAILKFSVRYFAKLAAQQQ